LILNFSIIIPTKARPAEIRATIQSLLALRPQQCGAEVIVVDNNTDERNSFDLSTYCKSLGQEVNYVREESVGLSAARHRGAAVARGEVLTFIDDDVELSSGWLLAIQRAFVDSAVSMVGGPSIPKFTCSIPGWFWDYFGPTPYGGWMCTWISLLDIGRDVEKIDPNFIWGLNFSIRKSVLYSCGGFHPDLVPAQYQRWQGDGETGLTRKVKAAGFRADYIQEAALFHKCGADRLNVEYFRRRAYYEGVCDSFAEVRGRYGLPEYELGDPRRRLYKKIRSVLNGLIRSVRGRNSRWIAEAALVRRTTDEAERQGWLFHQREVAADPALLAWVRREDYFNTDISGFE
jgi:glycosyltransferase involved in cell wall biosynthesis